MMTIKSIIIIIFIAITSYDNCFSFFTINDSTVKIIIGKPLPDVQFNDVEHFSKKAFNSTDFRGKWLVLDFWHEYCVSCIANMPKVKILKDKYADKVEFFLVGMIYNTKPSIKKLYERINSKYSLNIPVAYDIENYKRFGVYAAPFIIIVDPNGIVRGITYEITDKQMESFIRGESPELPRTYIADGPVEEIPLDPLEFVHKVVRDSSLLFGSLLTKYDTRQNSNLLYAGPKGLIAIRKDLKSLYRMAYFGKDIWLFGDSLYENLNINPILLMRDSSKFITNIATGKNYFNYIVSFPDSLINLRMESGFHLNEKTMDLIQNDLRSLFNYKVTIENRECAYLRLVKNQNYNPKIISESDTTIISEPFGPNQGISAQGLKISDLLALTARRPGAPKILSGITFKDETDIKGCINIDIKGVYFEEWVEELEKNGFNLVEAKRNMKCLVIRD